MAVQQAGTGVDSGFTAKPALRAADPEIARLMDEELTRQQDTLELIPSENLASVAVLEALGSWLNNKYAEGVPGKRYYGGCQVVDQVENLARERCRRLFGADHANVQPHSGSQANTAVYASVLKPGDTVLGLALDQGGHLTHGSPVNFSGRLYNFEAYTVSDASGRIDYEEVRARAHEVAPSLIVAGYSSYPRFLDFAAFEDIARDVGALLMVDMAHFAGLVAGGAHPSPVPHADFVTFTTHKTMRGPWGGVVLCRAEHADAIDKSVFPGTQGGPQMHAIAAKAVMFQQCLQPDFRVYARQVVDNAAALARGPDEPWRRAGHRRHRQPPHGRRPPSLRGARPRRPGRVRRGGDHRERQRVPRARGDALQPQRDPSGVALGHQSRDGRGGDGRDRRHDRRQADQLRRRRRARPGARAQPGSLQAVPAAVSPVIASTPWVSAVPPFLLASVVTMLLIPLTILLARRVGAVAEPDAHRHLHHQATPRLGGIALFGGFTVATIVFGGAISDRWQVVSVTAVITVAMLVDDIFDLPWNAKLTIELGAGVLVAALGITINFFAVPGGHGPSLVELGWLAGPITAIFVLGMEVSINLLDGSDGVAAGVVGIVGTVLLLAAVNRVQGPGDVQTGVIVLSGALIGCCCGFLVFNLPPARVFMGDTGSHFLGVALAMISVLGVAKIAVALALFVPLIALGLPIGDTAFAIVRRRRAGLSATQPDAGHLHHRMLATGMSPMETALTFYLMTAILGCVALFVFGHKRILDVALALLVVALVGLLWRARRRRPQLDADGFLVVRGRRQVPARVRRGGEAD